MSITFSAVLTLLGGWGSILKVAGGIFVGKLHGWYVAAKAEAVRLEAAAVADAKKIAADFKAKL